MMPRLVYCALVLVPALWLAGCSNLAGKSDAYRQAHQTAFWRDYNSGGTDAAAWANYRAHEAAERATGEK